uniref:Glycosyltransferase 2-like domain-containing protein n=1 Tax=Eubacterium plexicaudatum ASF492 TaxID=1235802 RepID=N2AGX6_9FIRM
MRFLIFGTGLFYTNRKKCFKNKNIVAFLDNDSSKQGNMIDGIEILSPKCIKNINYDCICIMTGSEYEEQIRKQLLELDIPSEKVVDFYGFRMLTDGDIMADRDEDSSWKFDFSNEPGKRLIKELNQVSSELALITVITPYYNAGKFFEQTFRSVMNQTFPWYEWIIINDGSTNQEDVQCLHKFANMDQRIRIITIENGGLSNARNVGFTNAKTEIVVPLDADDLISPQYLECVYFGLYYNKDASWCYSGGVGFYEMQYLWRKPWDAEEMKTYNSLMATAAIRKKDWKEVGGYKTEKLPYSEDWRFWLDMLALHKKPVSVSSYYFWYRRTSSGLLHALKQNPERSSYDRKIIQKAAEKADGTVKAVSYPGSFISEIYHKQEDVAWDDRRIISKKKNITRLLMIIPWMVMGGADKFNLDLLSGLDKTKFEVSIMTTIPSNNDWQYRFAEITDEIFHLPEFLDPAHYLEFVTYYIKTRQIDILFVSNSTEGYYMLPALRKAFINLRIIDYVHMEEWYWKCGGHARTSGMMGAVLNKTFVCNSATRKVLLEYFNRASKQVQTLYIGVDEEKFCPEKISSGYLYKTLEIERERPVILFPCRIHPQKRPFMVLEIADRIQQIHPEIVFVVVGDGPQLEELKGEIAKRNLEQSVMCIGRCDDMASCYKDAYLTLICSVKEGLALTAYESCSMGVPVISSAVGGQGDLIDEYVGKLITMRQKEDISLDDRKFEEKEIREYVHAISELLENKEWYRKCSINCRKRIVEKFSIKKMVENVENELDQLMHTENLEENKKKSQELQHFGYLAEEFYTLATALAVRENGYNIM